MSESELMTIAGQFEIPGIPGKILPHGLGHIHDTYYVSMMDPGHPGYILQKINGNIFSDTPPSFEDSFLITEHVEYHRCFSPGQVSVIRNEQSQHRLNNMPAS